MKKLINILIVSFFLSSFISCGHSHQSKSQRLVKANKNNSQKSNHVWTFNLSINKNNQIILKGKNLFKSNIIIKSNYIKNKKVVFKDQKKLVLFINPRKPFLLLSQLFTSFKSKDPIRFIIDSNFKEKLIHNFGNQNDFLILLKTPQKINYKKLKNIYLITEKNDQRTIDDFKIALSEIYHFIPNNLYERSFYFYQIKNLKSLSFISYNFWPLQNLTNFKSNILNAFINNSFHNLNPQKAASEYLYLTTKTLNNNQDDVLKWHQSYRQHFGWKPDSLKIKEENIIIGFCLTQIEKNNYPHLKSFKDKLLYFNGLINLDPCLNLINLKEAVIVDKENKEYQETLISNSPQ